MSVAGTYMTLMPPISQDSFSLHTTCLGVAWTMTGPLCLLGAEDAWGFWAAFVALTTVTGLTAGEVVASNFAGELLIDYAATETDRQPRRTRTTQQLQDSI